MSKTILITGGTGSFGSAFCRNIANNKEYKKIIVLSTSWEKQTALRNELGNPEHMRWFIGNVRDYDRLYQAFENVNVVIHAAAIKCIVTCQNDPEEALKTNVIGTQNVIRAAINRKVGKVLLISTDKAVAPINTYGATKALAENLIINANNYKGSKNIRFSVCRYGNVIGSAGSVLPVWKKLIADGAQSLPVTDAEMTRFWFPMDQAIKFVQDSLLHMKGGETFIPEIASIKITDLAKALNMPYHIVGLRKGEKIHESMSADYSSDKNRFLTVEEIKGML